MVKFLLYLLIMLPVCLVHAQDRDPTKYIRSATVGTVQSQQPLNILSYKIDGLVINNNKKYVIINGKRYQEGYTLGNTKYQVYKITKTNVLLKLDTTIAGSTAESQEEIKELKLPQHISKTK